MCTIQDEYSTMYNTYFNVGTLAPSVEGLNSFDYLPVTRQMEPQWTLSWRTWTPIPRRRCAQLSGTARR